MIWLRVDPHVDLLPVALADGDDDAAVEVWVLEPEADNVHHVDLDPAAAVRPQLDLGGLLLGEEGVVVLVDGDVVEVDPGVLVLGAGGAGEVDPDVGLGDLSPGVLELVGGHVEVLNVPVLVLRRDLVAVGWKRGKRERADTKFCCRIFISSGFSSSIALQFFLCK